MYDKLVLVSNRKLHTGFRLVLKSVNLSDPGMTNGCHYALLHTIQQLSKQTASNSLKFTVGNKKVAQEVFGNIWLMADDVHYLCGR